ncbi:RNA polymerase sigma factor [Streptomyces avicenniae]|uniref:RNA polymerase sigma factor n=1 Tax=Streptomyces avicenniae TaxID=500153 RepID=UPI00069934B9|nr:sigma-70 family RNA polymerase sigma factor [Streptomyces avicenniae]
MQGGSGRGGGEAGGGGGERAAEALFEDFYPRLAGWCRGLVDSDEVAHDIASEAFTRLWSRWSAVERPESYLFSVAANLVKDHWRGRDRERRAARDLDVAREHAPAADQGLGVRALVESLPDRQRVTVLLHYYAGLPVDEIAAVLRRRPGTVKSDLYKARQRLRSALRGPHDITT